MGLFFLLSFSAAENKSISTPIITSKTENYGIEGNQLEMNCTIEAELGANFHINWILPNDNISIKV